MKRSLYLFICDILEYIELIENSIKNLSKEKFESDRDSIDATVRRIEIIGEAAKNIPDSFRKKHQEIPWKDIAGMRDVITHGYFRVDLDTVWKVIKDDLSDLKNKILKIKTELENKDAGKNQKAKNKEEVVDIDFKVEREK